MNDHPPMINNGHPPMLQIERPHVEPPSLFEYEKNGKALITIDANGKVWVDQSVPMDELAKKFWEAVTYYHPECWRREGRQ